MTLASYWWSGTPNFGDQLAPLIIERLIGHKTCWTQTASPRLLSVGSILTHAKTHDIIWGSGTQYDNAPVCRELDVRMVRGPLTRDYMARYCDVQHTALGDPAILLPDLYEPKIGSCPGITVIPHYRDKQYYDGADRILDVCAMSPTEMIDAIVSSEMIVTSALHPLIVAEAYGGRAVAVHNNLDPGWRRSQELKFRDYYASTGRDDWSMPYSDMGTCLFRLMAIPRPDFPDRKRMIGAFPLDRMKELMIQGDMT